MFKKTFLILIGILILLTGCKTNKESTEIKKKDKGPESLTKLSQSLDKIMENIGKIEKINLGLTMDEQKPDEKSSGEDGNKENKGQSDTSGSDSSSNSESSGSNDSASKEQSGSQTKVVPKEQMLKDTWKEIDDTLEEAHSNLNEYEGEAIKKGLTGDNREKFHVSFNKMTKAVENRSVVDIYDFGSQSINNLKHFYDLYQDEIGGDISVLRYVAYQSYLRAISDDIEGALELFQNKDENINRIRLKLGDQEDRLKSLEKTSNSLEDMKKALEEKSKRLFMIKKDIIIKNLKDLE